MSETKLLSIIGNLGAARERLSLVKVIPETEADIAVMRRSLNDDWDDAYLLLTDLKKLNHEKRD